MANVARKDWANLLLDVTFQLNTSTSDALPRGKTPYDIWFGRKRYWLWQEQISDREVEEVDAEIQSVDGDPEVIVEVADAEPPAADEEVEAAVDAESTVSSDGGYDVSQPEAQVAEKNAQLHEQMKRKGASTGKTFARWEIATLWIPRKQRLSTEPSRLPVRIMDHNDGGYRLLSRYDAFPAT
jgi:hypothetical protein